MSIVAPRRFAGSSAGTAVSAFAFEVAVAHAPVKMNDADRRKVRNPSLKQTARIDYSPKVNCEVSSPSRLKWKGHAIESIACPLGKGKKFLKTFNAEVDRDQLLFLNPCDLCELCVKTNIVRRSLRELARVIVCDPGFAPGALCRRSLRELRPRLEFSG